MRLTPPMLAGLLTAAAALAADPRGDNPGTQPSTPEQERALFHLPPGFEIQLVAAEPEIQKPINLNFDAQGRLWVTGSEAYPWPAATDALGEPLPNFDKSYAEIVAAFARGNKAPEPVREGRDSVRILSDFDAAGHAGKVTVFADKLNIPGGVQPLPRAAGAKGDTAIVYSIPYIWRLEDTTGSGQADKRERLYGPFGYVDTHGGSASYIQWIDGWIYGTHGFRNHSEIKWKGGATTVDSGNTYRFKPDGSAFEYYTHGQTNPFGLTFDPAGNLYSADSHSKPVYMLVRGGYYEGIGKQDDGLGFAPRITDDDHGSSAIAGISYYADDKWPEEYRGNLFNGNPVTRRINRDKLEWTGSTPKAIRQPDFLTSDDPWFRPVNLKLGPDGALYIADFYNPIIGHYEVPLTDPHRDHSHGRIWKVVYKGEKAVAVLPDELAKMNVPKLIEKLGDANLEVRRLATNELVQREPDVTARLETELASQAALEAAGEAGALRAAHAFWVLSRLHVPDDDLASLFGKLRGHPTGLSHESPHLGKGFGPAGDSLLLQHWIRIMAELKSDMALRLATSGSVKDAAAKRASVENLEPDPGNALALPGLLKLWRTTVPADPELVYASRVASRNQLQAELAAGHGAELLKSLLTSAPDAPGDDSSRAAELALSIPGPQAAEFIFGYLRLTNYSHPRAGDLLKQAVLSLEPPERLNDFPLEQVSEHSAAKRLALAGALSDGARQRGLKLRPELVAWIGQQLVSSLSEADDKSLDRALAALRTWQSEAKVEPLRKLVLDSSRPEKRRASALEALYDSESGPAVTAAILANPASLPLRKRAAELLGQRAGSETGGDDARIALQTALATAPWELATTIGSALAKSELGAGVLLGEVKAGKAPAALLRHNAVAAPLSGRSGPLRDQARALTKDLPPEDARLDGLITQRAAAYRAALAKAGEEHPSAARGLLVFQQNCAACHKVKNQGGNIGPNLDGVSARGPERLMEDILDPNRNVDPAFRQVIIETTDGQTLAGVQPRRAGELLILSDAQGKEISLPAAQVKSQTASMISLMPPTFEQVLSEKALGDLAAFLLAQPGT